MKYTKSMDSVFERLQRSGWIYSFHPKPPTSKTFAATVRNMFKLGLLQKIDIPCQNYFDHEPQLVEALTVTEEGARVMCTAGFMIPYSDWTDWKGYRELELEPEWDSIIIPLVEMTDIRDWCLDNDVAIKARLASPNVRNQQIFITVEKSKITKFLLKWG